MAGLRLLGFLWLLHLKMMSRSAFDGLLAVLWPLFFATVAFFMFRAGRGASVLSPVALGAAVMGVWTATSVPASSALQRERWAGTLELLVSRRRTSRSSCCRSRSPPRPSVSTALRGR
jgi:ABC-2 type transport system permease protein